MSPGQQAVLLLNAISLEQVLIFDAREQVLTIDVWELGLKIDVEAVHHTEYTDHQTVVFQVHAVPRTGVRVSLSIVRLDPVAVRPRSLSLPRCTRSARRQ